MAEKKRYVLGMLVANIIDPFSNQAARGAMAAAEQLDCNLIIVPGKYICETSYSNSDTTYEYQYNNLFKYVGGQNLDAVCACVGTIAYANTDEEKKEFLQQLGNVPVISVASKIEGFEHVVFDNVESVRSAVNYIIKEQGRKKVACLSGYGTNSDYIERLEGYRLALEDNGIAYDEELVCYANPSRACQQDFANFLDAHPDVEAVVCSNDDMCIAVYDECTDRGMKIGSDILVVGFDDMDFCEKLDPPLSSIKASAEDLGYHAVVNAVNILRGKEPEKRNVPTRFVPRASCGYVGRRISDIDYFLTSPEGDRLGRLLYFMYDGTETCKDAYIIRCMGRIFEVIRAMENGSEMTKDMAIDVYDAVEKMIDYHREYFLYLKNIHLVADAVYDKLSTHAMSEQSKTNLENLYLEIYRLISRDIGVQIDRAGETSINLLRRSNILVRDTLTINQKGERAFSDILKRLPLLEVNSSFLYLLPAPVAYKQGDKLYDISKWKFMAYSDFEKVTAIPQSKRDISLERLFKNGYLPKRRFTLIMADLFSGEQQFGILLCELKSKFFEYLEFITYQFGAAVKIISLLNELESHMNELHHDNEELAGISRADELTGLLNRRGFNQAAQELVESSKATDKYAVIVFADLDYLKFINDRYGHNEGDFALRASAELLKKIFRSTDIIGRTGGDEFNVMAIVGSEPDIEKKILKRKQTFVETLNKESGKPYRIDLSMGICEFKCSEIEDLATIIEQADNKLYEAKRLRQYNPYKEEIK